MSIAVFSLKRGRAAPRHATQLKFTSAVMRYLVSLEGLNNSLKCKQSRMSLTECTKNLHFTVVDELQAKHALSNVYTFYQRRVAEHKTASSDDWEHTITCNFATSNIGPHPVCPQCKVHFPWALVCETVVFIILWPLHHKNASISMIVCHWH